MRKLTKLTVAIEPAFCVLLALSLLVFPVEWICAWFAATLVHELGHYLSLRMLRVNISALQINSRGVLMRSDPLTDIQHAVCSLSGPVAGLMLLPLAKYWPALAICGFIQSVFNLIPIYPLDGGAVIHFLLANCFGESVAWIISKVIGTCLQMLIPILLFVLGISLRSVPFFLLIALVFVFKTKGIKSPCKHRKVIVQ